MKASLIEIEKTSAAVSTIAYIRTYIAMKCRAPMMSRSIDRAVGRNERCVNAVT
jgi:hypothetical protein